MRKLIALLVVFVLVFSCSFLLASACGNGEPVDINLEGTKEGDVVYCEGLAFEKVSDSCINSPITRTTSEGFSVSNFGGNTSMNKVLTLNSTYRYFRILVKNEGSGNIKVDIGGIYTTSIGPGSMYIYSTKAWSAKSYTVSFSCDSGMYGSASAMLCTTLAEAEP